MEPLDPRRTKVLLIASGTGTKDQTIRSIPNIKVNIRKMQECFAHPDIAGIPRKNITISLDETATEIFAKIRLLASENPADQEALIIYYAGHGIFSTYDRELYLTCQNTTLGNLESGGGVHIGKFNFEIEQSRARRKFIILDCCYSASFILQRGGMRSPIEGSLAKFFNEGTYIMTSAAETEESFFPLKDSDQPTFFTGKLSEVLFQGLVNAGNYLLPQQIFQEVKRDLQSRNLSSPQQAIFNDGGDFRLIRNRSSNGKNSGQNEQKDYFEEEPVYPKYRPNPAADFHSDVLARFRKHVSIKAEIVDKWVLRTDFAKSDLAGYLLGNLILLLTIGPAIYYAWWKLSQLSGGVQSPTSAWILPVIAILYSCSGLAGMIRYALYPKKIDFDLSRAIIRRMDEDISLKIVSSLEIVTKKRHMLCNFTMKKSSKILKIELDMKGDARHPELFFAFLFNHYRVHPSIHVNGQTLDY